MCPLSRRVATVFGAVKILRLPLVKVTEQQGGELRSYSKYGTQLDFSPFPSVRPSFALLCFDCLPACLPPPPVARFASLPSSQRSQTSSSPAARDSRWRRLSPRRQPARWRTPRWILGSRVEASWLKETQGPLNPPLPPFRGEYTTVRAFLESFPPTFAT